VGTLAQLDPPKRPARAGAASAPPVPNSPASRVVTAHAELSEASNNLYALLGSQQKEVDARAIYRMLQEKYPAMLGKRNAIIRRADSDGQGTYYRVEVGPLTTGQADELCGSLRQAGAQCTQHYE
jgi:cell division septation protein DedD